MMNVNNPEAIGEAVESFNLTVVESADSILLGRKTRKYAVGLLACPGGKNSNSPVNVPTYRRIGFDAAREVHEETGLDLSPYIFRPRGLIRVWQNFNQKLIYVFGVRGIDLSPSEASAELIEIGWYPKHQIPYDEMPDDYQLWLPHILGGEAVHLYVEKEREETIYHDMTVSSADLNIPPKVYKTRLQD